MLAWAILVEYRLAAVTAAKLCQLLHKRQNLSDISIPDHVQPLTVFLSLLTRVVTRLPSTHSENLGDIDRIISCFEMRFSSNFVNIEFSDPSIVDPMFVDAGAMRAIACWVLSTWWAGCDSNTVVTRRLFIYRLSGTRCRACLHFLDSSDNLVTTPVDLIYFV